MTMEGAREDVLAGAPDVALRELAGLATAAQLGMLVQALDQQRDRLAQLMALSEAELAPGPSGARAGAPAVSEAELLADAVDWPGEAEVRHVAAARVQSGGSSVVKRHAAAHARLAGAAGRSAGRKLGRIGPAFCSTRTADPRAPKYFANEKLAAQHPDIARRHPDGAGPGDRGRRNARRTLQMAEATVGAAAARPADAARLRRAQGARPGCSTTPT